MMIWIGLVGIIAIFTIYLLSLDDGKPSTCPKCHKQYEKAEHWSYAEYAWGLRCPHCKHNFDITP
jgi:hypothetical protein